ncbi:MAG: DUF962 domain-containing protein [Thiolinea sp.]
MKTLEQWLDAYSESHQNITNKQIHNICVPVIFFVVVALLWKLGFFLFVLVAAGAIGFYYLLGKQAAVAGAAMIGGSLVLQWIFGFGWITLLVLFGLAWAGQFYGHKIEGQKPSFFDDLKFLLIGPLWVARPWLHKIKV